MINAIKRALFRNKEYPIQIDGITVNAPIIALKDGQKVLILRDTGKPIRSMIDGHFLGTEKEKMGVGIVSLDTGKIKVKRIPPTLKAVKTQSFNNALKRTTAIRNTNIKGIRLRKKSLNPDDNIYIIPAND